MNGYLDMHSHIIPGVDDGSENLEMSKYLVDRSYEEGVRVMVATPHHYVGYKNASPEHIKREFNALKEWAEEAHPDMRLLLGNEIYYKDEAINLLKEGKVFTMNESRYVLVEFNTGKPFEVLHNAITALTTAGYYPIIAHVERYACVHKRKDLIRELVNAGAYIQVNTDTFTLGIFDAYRRYAYDLLNSGLVHFLGSDCHNPDRRPPLMEGAVKTMRKKADPLILDRILNENAEKFIAGEFI
ncbi:MAG: histidinol-phosphatase [Lachnospiraceae bacterium]|nr:histidinol-phosphatase [Lachnospiraceae bacterium]